MSYNIHRKVFMENEPNNEIFASLTEIKDDDISRERLIREISCCKGTTQEGDCGSNHIEKDVKVDKRITDLLVKEFQGLYIKITSGYRCPKHNEFSVKDDKSGMTKPDSLHTKAQAVDLILYDKAGNPFLYEEYNHMINALHKKYQFSQPDWQSIYHHGDQNYLSKDNHNMIFAKAYKPDEGRDTDNKHPYSYMHIDFRGIDPSDPVARNYYNKISLKDRK